MKKIKLTQDKYTIVDDNDFIKVSKYKWCALKRRSNIFYAVSRKKLKCGKIKTVAMHRLIMGAKKGDVIDHINGDGLDNRRSNLRLCSLAENNRNRRKYKNNNSGLKGVFFNKLRNYWQAAIAKEHKSIHLGCFKTKEDAHAAYCRAAQKYHGEFARFK